MSKVLVGVLFYSPLIESRIIPPLFPLWDNFANHFRDNPDIQFVNVFGGPLAYKVDNNYLECCRIGNIGYLIDTLMEKALAESFDIVLICESDCFWLKEDFQNLITEFDSQDIDYLVPNNRTGWLINGAEELNETIPNTNYHRPLGKTTPSNGVMAIKTSWYHTFLDKYEEVFKNRIQPMNSETITYEEICQLANIKMKPDFSKDKVMVLDAFIRSNSWAILLSNDFKRGVVVNYDNQSFRCKSEHGNYRDFPNTKSILDTYDKTPMPEISGPKIQSPFFHLNHGTMIMLYLAPQDKGIKGYYSYLNKFNQKGMIDRHFILSKYLLTHNCLSKYNKSMNNFAKSNLAPQISEDFNDEVLSFYTPAFKDYLID